MHIQGDRSAGLLNGDITPDYINNIFQTAANAKQPFPNDVIARARDWFDTLMTVVSNTHESDTNGQTSTDSYIRHGVVAYAQADEQARQTDLQCAV